jgi:hypothetical protein
VPTRVASRSRSTVSLAPSPLPSTVTVVVGGPAEGFRAIAVPVAAAAPTGVVSKPATTTSTATRCTRPPACRKMLRNPLISGPFQALFRPASSRGLRYIIQTLGRPIRMTNATQPAHAGSPGAAAPTPCSHMIHSYMTVMQIIEVYPGQRFTRVPGRTHLPVAVRPGSSTSLLHSRFRGVASTRRRSGRLCATSLRFSRRPRRDRSRRRRGAPPTPVGLARKRKPWVRRPAPAGWRYPPQRCASDSACTNRA